MKINLNFHFQTSFHYPKKFYEGLKGLHKTFRGTTKKCEAPQKSAKMNINVHLIFLSGIETGRVKYSIVRLGLL